MTAAARRPGYGALAALAAGIVLLVADCGGEREPAVEPEGGHGREALSAEVTRVVDGDTVEVSVAGRREDVRYIGVDTPESVAPGQPVECYGRRASRANERLVEGRRVRLVFDRERRDDYGRLLAYVYLDGRLVNARLVRAGLARTLRIAPNTRQAGRLGRLERRAAGEGRGLWGAC